MAKYYGIEWHSIVSMKFKIVEIGAKEASIGQIG